MQRILDLALTEPCHGFYICYVIYFIYIYLEIFSCYHNETRKYIFV